MPTLMLTRPAWLIRFLRFLVRIKRDLEKYKNFLMAGGAITYSEFINMFDLDAFKPTLWKNSLETINDCITELEEYL